MAMEQLGNLLALGKELGYEGLELREFVREEQDREREERRLRREHEKEIKALEQSNVRERLQMERELKELEIQAADASNRSEQRLSVRDTGTVKSRAPKLPIFEDGKTDIDAYLLRFECFAESQEWPQHTWAINLSALLTGIALEVYSRLDDEEAEDYQVLKMALLKRYQMNDEGFRLKFLSSKGVDGESSTQYIVRLRNYFRRWVELSHTEKTYEALEDLLVREQFLNSCSKNLAVFLKERSPKSTEEMAQLAEMYREAHADLNSFMTTPKPSKPGKDSKPPFKAGDKICFKCGKLGHIAKDCKVKNKPWTKTVAAAISEDVKMLVTDHLHSKSGRVLEEASACVLHDCEHDCVGEKTLKLACGKQVPIVSGACNQPKETICGLKNMPVLKGKVGSKVVDTLRDTGCSGVVVKRSLVDDKQLTGKMHLCVLVDGTVKRVPTANINVDTPFYVGEVEAMCMDNPVCPLVLGNIPGASLPSEPNLSWSSLETEVKQSSDLAKEQAGAVQTRSQLGKAATPVKPLSVRKMMDMEVTTEVLIEAQKEDTTLKRYWELATTGSKSNRGKSSSWFEVKSDVLYRKFQSGGRTVKQLMVPQRLRIKVLRLAHEAITGAHLGIRKTCDKIMLNFYWPGLQNDVSRFCNSCDTCQRTVPKGRVSRVPLQNMPLIDTPFKRVAIDLLGPITPVSESGYRYMLSLIDYATRYPEVVPLKFIDAESVAEALVNIFTRVGIPTEILSDQGSQFLSRVMKEVGRLLSIKQMITTPYHPMCNGLVEKFHLVLKTMLKRLCQEKPKDWDRYVPAVLFAYREAPQASLGFSPFELLYGRTVRGPMQILHDLWTKEETPEEVKTTYEYVIDLRNRLEDTCKLAQEELKKTQVRSKTWYDKRSKPRKFQVGDSVLVMLPTDANKLLMSWRGPYKVEAVKGLNDYAVKIRGKAKIIHANMLKRYFQQVQDDGDIRVIEESGGPPLEIVSAALIEEEKEEASVMEEEWLNLCPTKAAEDYHNVSINPELTSCQKQQVTDLLQEFSCVFSDLPGSTTLIEHKIQLSNEDPIRKKPYPIPYHMRETVAEEVEQMLKLGVIRVCDSPFASPIVLVKKKDGKIRFCIDFRLLNLRTVFSTEPMMLSSDIYTKLHGHRYLSKFDMTKGYWQIPLEESSQEKTCFLTPQGSFCFLKMPFGLVNAAATFNKMARKLLKGLVYSDSYIDDILCHTPTWDDHLAELRRLFERLKSSNLTVKPSKCQIGYKDLTYVGNQVSGQGMKPEESKILNILAVPSPTTKKQVRSFLGFIGYYSKYIPNFSAVAAPLSDLTRKGQPNCVVWKEPQEKAFKSLKEHLAKRPILHVPDFSKPFILQSDASENGLGAVLVQEYDDGRFAVEYASKKLLPRERNYSVIEKECYALVWAVKKFAAYLHGREFEVETDHHPLMYLNKAKLENSRLMRWALALQSFSFKIRAIKGSDNVAADYLSRV